MTEQTFDRAMDNLNEVRRDLTESARKVERINEICKSEELKKVEELLNQARRILFDAV